MSTKRGIRTLVCAALASSVVLLAGCSSSGSVKSGAPKGDSSVSAPSSGSSSSAGGSDSSSSPSGDSSSSTDSSGGLGASDPGCDAAEKAMQDGTTAITSAAGNPSAAKSAIQGIADKMHAAAKQSKSSKASAAINKLGDDYASLASAVGGGGIPDTKNIMNDATDMATACVG